MPDTVRRRHATGVPLADFLAWLRELVGRRPIDRKDDVTMNAHSASVAGDDYGRAHLALNDVRNLNYNWDGAGAPRPSKHAVDHASTVLAMLQGSTIPAPKVFAMPDGGVALLWKPVTKQGLMEIEARLGEEEDEFTVGYAHVSGFDVHETGKNPPARIAQLVRDCFKNIDS